MNTHSLRLWLLFSEDSQDKICLFAGFVGGGDNDVFTGRQVETSAHLPQVDEGLRAGRRRVSQEEVLFKVNILTACILQTDGND